LETVFKNGSQTGSVVVTRWPGSNAGPNR